MVFTDYIQSITQDKIMPKVVDTILGGNVLSLRLLANGKPWSGESGKVPIKYLKNTTSQGSFDGFDTFDTTKVNTRTYMAFNPTGYYQSVTLSGIEVDINSISETQVIDLVKTEMESAQQDMLDSIGTIFYGVQSGKNFIGLGDIVDDGNTVATYGGKSRATYTSLKATKTAATNGVLSLPFMGSLYDGAAVGTNKPTLGVANETVWGLYESLLQPAVVLAYQQNGYPQVTRTGVANSRGALQGDLGFDALWYRGMPIAKDEKATAQALYMLNEPSIEWHGLKSHKYAPISLSSETIEGGPYEKDVPKTFGFCWTGLKEPTNQYAEIGQIILLGNLIGKNPRLNAVGTGITTV